jgi:hypothetical protein
MDNQKKARKHKIRTFNRIYKELQHNIKTVLKKSTHKSFDVTDIKVVDFFGEQMDSFLNLYEARDVELLKKVDLLQKFFFNKPPLSQQNKEVVWKYLETMYSLAKEEKKELAKVQAPLDLTNLSGILGNLMTDKDSGFGNLISDISKNLEGKITGTVDQTQILQDLMSGKMESGGINFQEIIQQATSSLKDKVDSGEIDIEKLKNTAEGIKSSLNI